MIVWCRKNARLEISDVAAALDRAPEEVASWERGESSPTFAQLCKLAKLCKRPVAVFYLPVPPRDFTVIRDFRKLSHGRPNQLSPALAFLIRTCRERQEWLSSFAQQEGGGPLSFVGSASVDQDVQAVGQSFRTLLGATLSEQRSQPSVNVAFRYWRDLCENLGACVFIATRSSVSTGEMRGFALADKYAPIVVVNGAERSYAARTFTLIHEMVHLLIAAEGISDQALSVNPRSDEQRIEVFCNAVAAETLVPSEDFRQRSLPFGDNLDLAMEQLSSVYRVSDQVIARRLFDMKIATRDFYERKLAEFANRVTTDDDEEREFAIPMETRVLNSVGKRFSRASVEAFHSGEIDGSELADLLNMKLHYLNKLEGKLFPRTAV